MSAGERAREARLAVTMLTRLPAGRIDDPPPLGAAVWAFPLVGVLPGLAMWAVFAALGGPVGALAAGLAGALLTGGLHHDGLADFADGMGGGRDRAHVLEIMRDSRIGSYGVLALVFAVALQALSVAEAAPGPVAFLCLGVASRFAMLVAMVRLPPAREDGLGRMAAGARGLWPGAALVAALGLWLGAAALPALLALGAAAAAIARIARVRIGGQTGDVLGAVQVASETAGWVTLATLSG